MKVKKESSRRNFLRTAAMGSMTPFIPGILDGESVLSNPVEQNGPLPPDYVVAYRVPEKEQKVGGTAMVGLGGGKFISVLDMLPTSKNKYCLVFLLSIDSGRTWEKVCEKPWNTAQLFVYNNEIYLFTQLAAGGVFVTTTSDEGRSWSDPIQVIKARPGLSFLANHGGMVVKDGWLYCAISDAARRMFAVACNLGKGLLNPEAWIVSNTEEMPIPEALVSGTFTDGEGAVLMRTLEGNIVDVYGRMLLISRACINHYGTQNMAAVFDLKRENEKLKLSFTQLYPMPGGQNRFQIIWDEPSKLFWMGSTYATNSQDLIHAAAQFPNYKPTIWHPIREDRRILMLSYSLDSLNWFQAGCIAKAEKMNQAFNSPSMVVEGDDMVVLSRTSLNGPNFHDADLATFHRIRNFRSMAMDIAPKV